MTADTPHARLAELADQCENTDTGDGVMETPVEQARQIAADLRAVLGSEQDIASRLWLAFRAGFARSGEGYNGQYGGPCAEQAPRSDEQLRHDFTTWYREDGAR